MLSCLHRLLFMLGFVLLLALPVASGQPTVTKNGDVWINEVCATQTDRLVQWPTHPNWPSEVGPPASASVVRNTPEGPLAWTQSDFDASGWKSGPGGLGYSDGDDATDLQAEMQNIGTSLYVRQTFTLTSAPVTLGSALTLMLDYDDGFVAYLNGTEIARDGVPDLEVVPYYSLATKSREAGEPVSFTVPSGLLAAGENTLAFLVLNSTVDSSDLSIIADLTADADGTELVRHEDIWRYFVGVWEPIMNAPAKEPLTIEPPKIGWGVPWHSPRFDDSDWISIAGDFKGVWTSALYARHTFDVTADQLSSGELEMAVEYAGGVIVYLNGLEVARRNLGESGTYVKRFQQSHTFHSTSSAEVYGLGGAAELLRLGKNTIAVELRQMPLEDPLRYVTLGVTLRIAEGDDLVTSADFWRGFIDPGEPSGALRDSTGEMVDWIELYNAGVNAVDMSGWSLSDDPNTLDKWHFPIGLTLQPDAHLLVLASDRNEMVGNMLHLNFKLNGEGEYLALFDTSLDPVCEILPGFPRQSPNYSWGRMGDTDKFGFLDSPTPGSKNVQGDSRLGWTRVGFADASWSIGVGGFGYGDDDDATVLEPEMLDVTPSLYLRSAFAVDWDDLSREGALVLTVDFDDGFIAFLNGHEVGRAVMGEAGEYFAHDQISHGDHEAGVPVRYAIGAAIDLLREGQNVLAIQAHNRGADSSDMTIKADLDIVTAGESVPLVERGKTWRYFVGTTEPVAGKYDPALSNTLVAGVYDAMMEAPLFLPERGFFDDPVLVTLTEANPGAKMRYTVDGSDPTLLNGLDYTQPVLVSGNTVLRARAFRSGALPSAIATQSYFVGMAPVMKSLPIISLSGDAGRKFFAPYGVTAVIGGTYDGDGHWHAVLPDDYNLPMMSGDAMERFISFEMLYPWTGETLQADCGVRFAGSEWTRQDYVMGEKASLRLYFRDDYGTDWLKHPMMGDIGVEEFKRVTLRAGKNDWANPFIRDELTRRLFLDMGWLTPHGMLANVFINGEFQGFYNPVERPDKYFFRSWNRDMAVDWDVVHNGDLQDGDWEKFNEMTNALIDADMTNPADYAVISELIDIENTIDYYLLNTFAATDDWGSNNWGIARKQAEGGKFRFYVWDAEVAFTRSRESANVFDDVLHLYNTPNKTVAFVFTKLQASPEFRLQFADHIQKHLVSNGGVLTLSHIEQRFRELQDVIQPMVEHVFWKFDTHLVNEWVPARYPIVIQQYIDEGLWPGVEDLQPPMVCVLSPTPTTEMLLLNPNDRGALYYTLDGSDPRVSLSGALSAKAVAYVLPLQLETSVFLNMRVRDGEEWSPLVEKSVSIPAVPGSVIVTEFLANPSGNDEGKEWIEVYNTTDGAVALNGWTIVDAGGSSHVIALGAAVIVEPRSHLVLGASADPLINGGVSVDYAYGHNINLSNSADSITLQQGEVVIHSVAYGAAAPVSAPERGVALGMAENYYEGAVEEWANQTSAFGSNEDLGTPGEKNDSVMLHLPIDWELYTITLNGRRLIPGDPILAAYGVVVTGGGPRDSLKIRLNKEVSGYVPIARVETDGGFKKVYSDVPVSLLQAQGDVRSVTTKGAVIENIRAQRVGKVKMTGYSNVMVVPESAPYPMSGALLTSMIYSVGGGEDDLRADVLLKGVVLGDLTLPGQDVGTISVASKLYKRADKSRAMAYGAIGIPNGRSRLFAKSIKKVLASGAAIFAELLDADSIGQVSTKGVAFRADTVMVVPGDILCDTIRTGVSTLKISTRGGSIAPTWISCGGPIKSISAKAKKLGGEIYGGFLGATGPNDDVLTSTASVVRLNVLSGSLYVPDVAATDRPAPLPIMDPLITSPAYIGTLSGDRGMRVLIRAGADAAGEALFSGEVKTISVGLGSYGLRGKVWLKQGKKPMRIKGDAPTDAEFQRIYE